MGMKEVIAQALELAKAVAPMIPTVAEAEAIALKIEGIFNDLHKHASLGEQIAMQQDRKVFAEQVVAKAKAESAALKGQ